ncbi:MAG: cupin domain-containing protein [Chloroflexi bacterium]|nr:cupin domain-containing protein [Chloroflexota bacterium]
MESFEIVDLITMQQHVGERYMEFLRANTMSMGLYVLPKGDIDPQLPHVEDEVYYVVSGAATLRVGEEDRPVKPGSLVFVEAGAEHKFHSITENLTLLVIFAPPQTRAE